MVPLIIFPSLSNPGLLRLDCGLSFRILESLDPQWSVRGNAQGAIERQKVTKTGRLFFGLPFYFSAIICSALIKISL